MYAPTPRSILESNATGKILKEAQTHVENALSLTEVMLPEELLNKKYDDPVIIDSVSKLTDYAINALSLTEIMLSEREKTHGDFIDHARVTYRLKRVLKDESEIMGKQLSPVQNEALEMICHKIGRIFAGNPDFIDHWDDIAGYATLVAKNLRQQKQGEDENGK